MTVAVACVRCGFEFHPRGYEARCPDCRGHTAPPTRPNSVLVLQLAGEVATLRLAAEAARARLAMGLLGREIGRDSLLEAAEEAYRILSGTRPRDEGSAIPPQRAASDAA